MEKDKETTDASVKPAAPAPPPKICPLRKQKLIGDVIFGQNEIDAPCVEEGCAWWVAYQKECALVNICHHLSNTRDEMQHLQTLLNDKLPDA